jgi:hypothetical protein
MIFERKPIERRYIPQQQHMGYPSIVILVFALFLTTLLQINILSRTSKLETSLNNMRNACVQVVEKEKR